LRKSLTLATTIDRPRLGIRPPRRYRFTVHAILSAFRGSLPFRKSLTLAATIGRPRPGILPPRRYRLTVHAILSAFRGAYAFRKNLAVAGTSDRPRLGVREGCGGTRFSAGTGAGRGAFSVGESACSCRGAVNSRARITSAPRHGCLAQSAAEPALLVVRPAAGVTNPTAMGAALCANRHPLSGLIGARPARGRLLHGVASAFVKAALADGRSGGRKAAGPAAM